MGEALHTRDARAIANVERNEEPPRRASASRLRSILLRFPAPHSITILGRLAATTLTAPEEHDDI